MCTYRLYTCTTILLCTFYKAYAKTEFKRKKKKVFSYRSYIEVTID